MRRLLGISDQAPSRLIEFLTLALAGFLALRAPGLGDYPFDAGPALTAIAHGSLSGFFSHQAVMGPLSLYLRAPFAALGAALHDGPLGLYRWGALPCLIAVAILAIWLARIARRRTALSSRGPSGLLAQALIAAVCLLNPLVSDALYCGHPEDLLTASLAVGALLAACERRVVLTAVLLGLAVASKQSALVIVAPFILALDGNRVRALLISGGVALLSTVPMVVGNLSPFRNVLHYVAAAPRVVGDFTWLYPFSPAGRIKMTSIYGDPRVFDAHTLVGIESIARPLITVLGVAIPLLVWWRLGRPLGGEQMLLCAALALVLRCALDPGSVGYYHYPIVVTLLALDVIAGRRIPVAGLAASAIAFVVVDRFAFYLPETLVNAVYIAVSVGACALLLGALRASTRSRTEPGAPLSELLGERVSPA